MPVERWGAWPYTKPVPSDAVIEEERRWNKRLHPVKLRRNGFHSKKSARPALVGLNLSEGPNNRAQRRKQVKDLQRVIRPFKIAAAAHREKARQDALHIRHKLGPGLDA
jgi:hypothetical protein